MPTSIAIIHTSDFLRVKSDGALDLEASRKLLVQVVAAVKSAGEDNVLVDTRATAPTRLSTTDLWKLGVAAGTQPALARGRVAMLVPLDEQDDAEFFENVARVEGVNLRAFTDFERAITWLIVREQSQV